MCDSKSNDISMLPSISAACTMLKPAPTQGMLPMIEQRIRDAVAPKVARAEKDLAALIAIEIRKLGINEQLTNLSQFTKKISEQYGERLVAERITAIVDALTGTNE